MNQEKLEKKIVELLNVSEANRGRVFSLFKEKLAQFLSVGEALKIKNIGIFQLKEQIGHSVKSKLLDPGDKDLTLLFSPESDENSVDSIFMTMELENKDKDDSEFDENVFQLGIGKQFVTSSDKIYDFEETEIKELDQSIFELLNKSEKITNFDLWEDHLKSKGSKNILEDEILNSDDESEEVEKDILSEDFVKMDEEELLEDYEEDHQLLSSDLDEKLIEEIKTDEMSFEQKVKLEIDNDLAFNDDLDDNLTELVNDLPDDEELEVKKASLEHEKIEVNELETDLMEESDNIEEENEIEYSNIQQTEISKEQINIQEEVDEELDDEELDDEIKDEPNTDEEEAVETSSTLSSISESKKVKSSNNRTMAIFLVAAFIIVGALSSYYLLFIDTPEVNNETELITSNESSSQDDALGIDNTVNKTDLESTSSDENITKFTGSEVKSETKPNESSSTDNNQQVDESEVSQNVFFDGSAYNVQVSSWKQKIIAEREVNKLINKDYPGFILKVYIPKFDGTWHRVRVGPYKTINEAKAVRDKLKK